MTNLEESVSLYLIKIDFDWTDISGSNCSVGEVAMFPLSGIHDSLVEVEQALDPSRYTRVHTQQFTWNRISLALKKVRYSYNIIQ